MNEEKEQLLKSCSLVWLYGTRTTFFSPLLYLNDSQQIDAGSNTNIVFLSLAFKTNYTHP